MKPILTTLTGCLIFCAQGFAAAAESRSLAQTAGGKPNIIFILADDIGYGDLGCYGATKVQTPHIDRLAAQGLRMTDAHSMASVCTPTRYSFLTGEYAFRKNGTGIASGVEGLLIEQHQGGPFFLEIATHNIHVPRAPNPQFRGKIQCGVRGDAIVEFDWTVGQVLAKLDELKLTGNTLVILTSDNGGILDDNGPDTVHGIGSIQANNGHKFNGALRGTKGTLWEGGTRVPMIARWPGHVEPGVSDALVCQVDMLASFAALTGQMLAPADGPDSFNVLPALLGRKTDAPCRDYLVAQNNDGSLLALRHGSWKYIPDHGGRKAARGKKGKPSAAVPDPSPATGALYNLADDLAETKNIASANPDIVAEMSAKLAEIKTHRKSRS